MASVKLVHTSKIYENQVIGVRDINLEIKDREFVVIVGPSGCGKSTLLRLIAGLEEVTEGDIFIDDQRVNDVTPKDRDIAMVFQNYALYPHMSVFDNMAFGLKLRKFPKKEIQKRVYEAAEILQIQDILNRKPRALSGGQRQRVALGRAIVRKPKVFLFDEPLSNLDAKLRVQTRVELHRLHEKLQSTMIYVTHDQVEAMTMGERIVVMHKGVIQQVDTPMGIYQKPTNQFVAGFIGTPPMNFIPGKFVDGKTVRFYVDDIQIRLPSRLANTIRSSGIREAILGIRPEDIELFPLKKKEGKILRAKVDVIESIGNETYIYLVFQKHHLCVRVFSGNTSWIESGKEVGFQLHYDRIHFFEPSQGNRLF